jgi:hypothetical protein
VARSSKVQSRGSCEVTAFTPAGHHSTLNPAGESGQECAGIDDLLRHPGTGFGNITFEHVECPVLGFSGPMVTPLRRE